MTQDTHAARQAKGHVVFDQGREARVALLDQIGQARGSTVITYFTSTRENFDSYVDDRDVRVLERHVRMAKADGAEAIDLFLCTTGGMATFPWDFIAMFREHLPQARLGIIVPYWAYSAGTSTALGGDEVIMGPSSILGPVDSWIPRPYLSYITSSRLIESYLELMEEVRARKGKLSGELPAQLSENSDPLLLGALHRMARENERKLDKVMGARRKPLSKSQREALKRFFLDGVSLHGQGIRRSEAREAGLSYLINSEAAGIHDEMEGLFEHYAEAMKLFHPFASDFDPDTEVFGGHFDSYGQHSSETPVAVVESRYDSNPAFSAYYSDRHWDAPPPLPTPQQTGPAGPDERLQANTPRNLRLNWTNRAQLAQYAEAKPAGETSSEE